MNSHPLIIHTVTGNQAFNIHLHPSTLLMLICINSIIHEPSTSIQSFSVEHLYDHRPIRARPSNKGGIQRLSRSCWRLRQDRCRIPRLPHWSADTKMIEISGQGTSSRFQQWFTMYNMCHLHFHLHILHGVFAVMPHHESVLISVWGSMCVPHESVDSAAQSLWWLSWDQSPCRMSYCALRSS